MGHVPWCMLDVFIYRIYTCCYALGVDHAHCKELQDAGFVVRDTETRC